MWREPHEGRVAPLSGRPQEASGDRRPRWMAIPALVAGQNSAYRPPRWHLPSLHGGPTRRHSEATLRSWRPDRAPLRGYAPVMPNRRVIHRRPHRPRRRSHRAGRPAAPAARGRPAAGNGRHHRGGRGPPTGGHARRARRARRAPRTARRVPHAQRRPAARRTMILTGWCCATSSPPCADGRTAGRPPRPSATCTCRRPARPIGYPEVVEVLHGEAGFLIQDLAIDHGRPRSGHAWLVRARAGDWVVLPPDLAHVTIDLGAGPLVFSDVIDRRARGIYAGVAAAHGFGWYVAADGGLRPNPRYAQPPQLEEVAASDWSGPAPDALYARFRADPGLPSPGSPTRRSSRPRGPPWRIACETASPCRDAARGRESTPTPGSTRRELTSAHRPPHPCRSEACALPRSSWAARPPR